MFVYYEKNNHFVLIKSDINSEEDPYPYIHNFIKSKNPNFKVPYIRIWKTPDGIEHYDVGSHTEFFCVSEKELN